MIKVGDKSLVTVDNWFYAPDGIQYRAVFGTVQAVSGDQDTLGVKTNARSTNWYVTIGGMLIAGCQVHYAIKCDDANTGDIQDFREVDGKMHTFTRPSYIYRAD